jgi:hypothetical protein
MKIKIKLDAGWLPLTILSTWEAEIRRTVVWGQSSQKVHEISSQPIAGCSGVCLLYPRYPRGWAWDGEDPGSMPAQAKKFAWPQLNRKKLGIVAPAYHSSYSTECKIRELQPRQRPHLQNIQSKKDWRSGSSSRVPPSKHKVLSVFIFFFNFFIVVLSGGYTWHLQMCNTWVHPLHHFSLSCSWDSFNRSHFSIYMHAYTVCTPHPPSHTFPHLHPPLQIPPTAGM